MLSSNCLPIYHKLFIFTKLLYKAVHNMPREYKYTLGSDCLNLCWTCLDVVMAANAKPNSEKPAELERLSSNFDKLKIRLRLMQEIRIISAGQFSHWQENYLSPIGQQIGGWFKWSKLRI